MFRHCCLPRAGPTPGKKLKRVSEQQVSSPAFFPEMRPRAAWPASAHAGPTCGECVVSQTLHRHDGQELYPRFALGLPERRDCLGHLQLPWLRVPRHGVASRVILFASPSSPSHLAGARPQREPRMVKWSSRISRTQKPHQIGTSSPEPRMLVPRYSSRAIEHCSFSPGAFPTSPKTTGAACLAAITVSLLLTMRRPRPHTVRTRPLSPSRR